MIKHFELQYADLIREVLCTGLYRKTRNGGTYSLFGRSILIGDLETSFPLIKGRKIYPKSVFGEFAAFIRGAKHIEDFKKWGCNYWDMWARPDGSLDVDYGTQWINFNGVNQLEELIKGIKENPASRRHIVSGWRPDRLSIVCLPSCHFLYQWYVNEDKLEMIWYQRSVDLMIGLPADFILAALFQLCLCEDTGLKPGKILMNFGDCHIYEEHTEGVAEYLNRIEVMKERIKEPTKVPYIVHEASLLNNSIQFTPDSIEVQYEGYADPIKFELKA